MQVARIAERHQVAVLIPLGQLAIDARHIVQQRPLMNAALAFLERAIRAAQERGRLSRELQYIQIEPSLDHFRSEPEFQQLLKDSLP